MSIVFSHPVSRDRERGLVLVSVLVIAALYFALMHLILIESAEKMRTAQRFRARVVADLLAEDSLELAAERMFSSPARTIDQRLEEGSVRGEFRRLAGNRFRMEGTAEVDGVVAATATIELTGRLRGSRVEIQTLEHRRR